MKFNKQGQIFILSSLFLIIVLIFSYSVETDNTYIVKTGKYYLLDNIKYETCKIGTLSTGPNIVSRYNSFETNIDSYCSGFGFVCDITITNNTILPTNTSLINYTMFNYNIKYNNSGFYKNTNFTC